MDDIEFKGRLAEGLRWRPLRGDHRHERLRYPSWFGWSTFLDAELMLEVQRRLAEAYSSLPRRESAIRYIVAVPESGNPYASILQSFLAETHEPVSLLFLKFGDAINEKFREHLEDHLPKRGTIEVVLVDSAIDTAGSLTEALILLRSEVPQLEVAGVLSVVENDLNPFLPSVTYRELLAKHSEKVVRLAYVSELLPLGAAEYRDWDGRLLHTVLERVAGPGAAAEPEIS